MTDTAPLTPRQRVLMFVGGNFSRAALGPRYQQVLDAIDADPRAHLAAFDQLFLAHPATRLDLTDRHLDSFVARMARHLPQEAREVARRLLARMASLARAQAREMAEAADESSTGEIDRQQRQLVARRDVLARVARPA
jgi:enoyl-CoA hydratase/carnithine racemase